MRVGGFVRAVAVTAALFFSNAALAQEYAAEVYPGARLDPKGGGEQTVTFYSADPVEKVLDFYGASEKAREEMYSAGAFIETIDQKQVYAFEEAAGWKFWQLGNTGNTAGVWVSAVEPPSPQQLAYVCGGTNAPLGLMSTQYQLWGRDKADLDTACEQYGHLATAVYMSSGRLADNGREMDQGQVIEKELTAKVRGEINTDVADQQAIALKMKEAMANNDMQEVQRLVRSMNVAARKTATQDNWDDAMDALVRMDAIDYRTRIVVNTHPSTWKVPE
jgi:hypothetical protein